MKIENENLPLTLHTTRWQNFLWLLVIAVLAVGTFFFHWERGSGVLIWGILWLVACIYLILQLIKPNQKVCLIDSKGIWDLRESENEITGEPVRWEDIEDVKFDTNFNAKTYLQVYVKDLNKYPHGTHVMDSAVLHLRIDNCNVSVPKVKRIVQAYLEIA